MNLMPSPTGTGSDAGCSPYPDLTLTSTPVPVPLRSFLPAQARAGARFTGPAQVRTLGVLQVSTYRGAARSLVRSADDSTDPYLTLGVHSFGRATLVRGDGTAPCGPDDIFVCDGAVPFLLHEAKPFELHLVRIPRHALALTDRQVRALADRPPFADGPVAPLLGPLLRTFIDTLPEYAPRTALRLATTIAGFVDSLAGEAEETGEAGEAEETGEAGEPAQAMPVAQVMPVADTAADTRTAQDARPPEPVPEPAREQSELVHRVRAYVDTRLWDRSLTPATVAEAQHISVRYLHKLFEGQGSTIGRWIQHRRLEEARRELAAPESAGLTVSAVARRWGFANATHFSRSFRAAYGMSPRDWRSRTRPSGYTRSEDG
jgi:AraC-like DNA-binding protein